ncbi:MAG TPA: metal-sulfur cluster assembly factor [Chitinophagales bacterium]|nr:metal-sulfur cluster assembly factor [Chitinophagales bacterium]
MNITTNNDEKSEIAIAALYDVIDPEIGLNIVDLGLIYEINFSEKSKDIVVNMTLTTQFCPMGESIVESTTQAMKQSFPEEEIHVNLTFEPPWNQGMISEEGVNFLNG